VRLDVDVVAAFGIQAARAMQRSTATIPIVVMTDELVGHGLVVSLSRPGGNTTGVQILAPELNAKKLELLKQILPALSRVVVFVDPGIGAVHKPLLEQAELSLDVQLQLLEVRVESDIESIAAAARGSGDRRLMTARNTPRGVRTCCCASPQLEAMLWGAGSRRSSRPLRITACQSRARAPRANVIALRPV
jgi:putative ABC transport system substrate-binding protein